MVSSIQNKFRLSSFYGFFNLSVIFYITMKTAYLKFRFLELLILSNNPANGLILALYIAVSTGCIFVVIGKDNQNSSSSCRGSFIDIWELVIVNLSIVKLFVKWLIGASFIISCKKNTFLYVWTWCNVIKYLEFSKISFDW